MKSKLPLNLSVFTLLLVSSFCLYYKIIHGKFYMEDFNAIVNECHNYKDFFTGTCRKWYSPISLSVIEVDLRLLHNPPVITHCTAIVIHALYCFILYLLLREMVSIPYAIMGSFALLIHPQCTSGLGWTAEIHQIFTSVSGLLCVYFFYLKNKISGFRFQVSNTRFQVSNTRFQVSNSKFQKGETIYYFLSIFFCLLSLLSKESGINILGLIVMVGIADILVNQNEISKKNLSALLLNISPFIVMVGIYTLFRIFYLESSHFFQGGDYSMHFGFNMIKNFLQLLGGMIMPVSTVWLHSWLIRENYFSLILILLVFILPIIFVLYKFVKCNLLHFTILFSMIICASIPYILLNKVSEVYLYHPLPYFIFLMTLSFGWLIKKTNSYKLKSFIYVYLGIWFCTSIVSNLSKQKIIFDNGEKTTQLIKDIFKFKDKIKNFDNLYLVHKTLNTNSYSIYKQEGFSLIYNAVGLKSIVNVVLKNDKLKVMVLEDPEYLSIIPSGKDCFLVYDRGKLTFYDRKP